MAGVGLRMHAGCSGRAGRWIRVADAETCAFWWRAASFLRGMPRECGNWGRHALGFAWQAWVIVHPTSGFMWQASRIITGVSRGVVLRGRRGEACAGGEIA